ncbi:SulP family inorganic anion transporter [Streptomyces sp. NPDC001903]|uniref:SulP family inorganic anion transporter n=1 Tax=Streptomyces sp. NPDC001903 TaxID=3364622 RepID=UPI0036872732
MAGHSRTDHPSGARRRRLRSLPYGRDVTASLVVFLVALPLCVGVAVASGVPAEQGLITGIVGGLLTGLLPGSSLQVSGPAAGLTVLVFETVQTYGLGGLAALVVAAGVLQVLLGLARCGRFFRAISLSVVEGMLAGIGLVVIAGQLYTMADAAQPAGGLAKLAGIPQLLMAPPSWPALGIGCLTLAVLTAWPHAPARLRTVPGPLVAVAGATALTGATGAGAARLEFTGLAEAIAPPGAADFALFGSAGAIGALLALTLIASAESLFSAAAVDRLHDGPRTDYDKELIAQGAGNTVCGLLGALPLTAVIVRSAANVQAGARTKAARVLHGAWLLLFAALLPWALEAIPVAALAAVLVHAGFKLLPLRGLLALWRAHRGEAAILMATALAIVAVNMFEGVLLGLGLSVLKAAWDTSRIQLRVHTAGTGTARVEMSGNATFLRLPTILATLERLPAHRAVELDLTALRHLDHACGAALVQWADRHNRTSEVHITYGTAVAPP